MSAWITEDPDSANVILVRNPDNQELHNAVVVKTTRCGDDILIYGKFRYQAPFLFDHIPDDIDHLAPPNNRILIKPHMPQEMWRERCGIAVAAIERAGGNVILASRELLNR
jgi:hypothetical protein